jgi:hypothetical protein
MQISWNRALKFAAIGHALAIALGATTVAIPHAAYAQAAVTDDIQVVAHRPAANQVDSVVIDGVVHLIGFDRVKSGSGGRLEFTGDTILLETDKASSTIAFRSVDFFAIEHSTKALMRGVKGKLAGLAPMGVGQLFNAVRAGSETLTLFYTDENDALHGAVVIIPSKSKEDVLLAFARAGLAPGELPKADTPDVRQGVSGNRLAVSGGRPSIRIALPETDAQLLPAAFTAGIYEELVEQTMRSGLFETVWRQGDVRANGNVLKLTLDITQYKKGNAGMRGALPVVGMVVGKTQIDAEMRLADASGAVILEKEVKGSKRMTGESIDATKSLAQRVTASLAEIPGFSKGAPSMEVASR